MALTLTQFRKEGTEGVRRKGEKLRNTVVPTGHQSASQLSPFLPVSDHRHRPKQCFTKAEKTTTKILLMAENYKGQKLK